MNNKLKFFKGLAFGILFSAFMWTGVIWSMKKMVNKSSNIKIEQTVEDNPIVLN